LEEKGGGPVGRHSKSSSKWTFYLSLFREGVEGGVLGFNSTGGGLLVG